MLLSSPAGMGGSRSAGSKPTCGHATAFPSRCDAQCLMTPAKYVAGVFHCSIPLQFASSDCSATHTDGGFGGSFAVGRTWATSAYGREDQRCEWRTACAVPASRIGVL